MIEAFVITKKETFGFLADIASKKLPTGKYPPIFVHRDDVADWENLQVKDHVSCKVVDVPRGKQARSVKKIISLGQSETPSSGVIESLYDGFGFIKSCEISLDL